MNKDLENLLKLLYDSIQSVKNKPKKLCEGCNFLCLDDEYICVRCGAYQFRYITKEEEKNVNIYDIKLEDLI